MTRSAGNRADLRIVGVDVGGANLKYASVAGTTRSTAFAMWRRWHELSDAIADDLDSFGPIDRLAVTMTGELADCYEDRAAGVRHIVSQTCQAASRHSIDQVMFYGVDGRFRCPQDAGRDVDFVAAANWHALASYVGREIASETTLVDIGSTTTDVIPISSGRVATSALTDHDRLIEGSLIYVGCRRTPACALVRRLNYRGESCRVMNELFATVDDARILTGAVRPDPDDCDTADGKPRTIEFATARLARLIGLDRRTVSTADARDLATQIIAAAQHPIREVLEARRSVSTIVLSGHGPDLLDLPGASSVIELSAALGPDLSRCAPSYAVASLGCQFTECFKPTPRQRSMPCEEPET